MVLGRIDLKDTEKIKFIAIFVCLFVSFHFMVFFFPIKIHLLHIDQYQVQIKFPFLFIFFICFFVFFERCCSLPLICGL